MLPDCASAQEVASRSQWFRGRGGEQTGLETFRTDDIQRAVGQVSFFRGWIRRVQPGGRPKRSPCGSGWLKRGNPDAENRLVPAELDLRFG